MTPNRIQLITSLSPGQCVSRIAPLINRESLPCCDISGMFGSKHISGKVTETSLHLHQRHRNTRPPFHAFLTASIQTEAQHTIISGEVQIHFLPLFFLSMVFLVTALSGTIGLACTVNAAVKSRIDFITFVAVAGFSLAMLGIAFAAVKCRRDIIRDETRFLTEFLIQTLVVQERNAPAAPQDINNLPQKLC